MFRFFAQFIRALKNRFQKSGNGAREDGRLDLGFRVIDGELTRRRVTLTNARRSMHMAVLGKTGSGKSSFLRHLSAQDIEAGRGFVYFDLHGDATPFLLRTVSTLERRLHRHLSNRLILIDPADSVVSVGFNPLEQESPDFVRIAEFAQVLRERWALDHFGARTDELLRNALFVLSANGLTLLELAPLLTHSGFRTTAVQRVTNPEVREYFASRYDQVSEAMRATMREPILNKTSAFTADPHFRHIIGQTRSTFSIREAMDEGYWVVVDLAKGRLGEQAFTLGSLILTVIKNALFTREKRSLYTLYCDEIQNLVAYGSGIETILSEARKFGVSVVSANQFLDQYPAEMRAAILAVGTHAFFQLSSADANLVAKALDGGRPLAERLKNLPQRSCVVKSGPDRYAEVCIPTIRNLENDYTDLLNRSRYLWGRVRTHIEHEIEKRQTVVRQSTAEALHEWE
jgi:energy-coupling factor transporter ATP-binding protein EcfA2